MLVWCHLCTLMTMNIYLANLITCANGENPKFPQIFNYETVFKNAISSGILLVNRLDLSLISNKFVVVQSWCHPTTSSSVVPFSSCPQSFPALGASPVSQLFALGGQSTGASASASVLPMNIQGWFPLGLIGLISLQFKGSRVFSSSTIWKHQFFSTQPSLWSNSHIHTWLLEKT